MPWCRSARSREKWRVVFILRVRGRAPVYGYHVRPLTSSVTKQWYASRQRCIYYVFYIWIYSLIVILCLLLFFFFSICLAAILSYWFFLLPHAVTFVSSVFFFMCDYPASPFLPHCDCQARFRVKHTYCHCPRHSRCIWQHNHGASATPSPVAFRIVAEVNYW